MSQYKYMILIAMISVSLLNIAMLFTYRLVAIGPFLLPGGIIVFPLTYICADIIAEVYGYKNAKLLIWGNFVCIIIFNLTAKGLLVLPTAYNTNETIYLIMFSHSSAIIFGYCVGFALGDFLNAYAISKLGFYLHGKYFAIRSIASCIVGQFIFSVVVSLIMYSSNLNNIALLRQFFSTVFIKIVIIMILAYPSAIIVVILKKLEKLNVSSKVNDFQPLCC